MITFLGVNMSVAVWPALSACSYSASWLPLYHLTSTCLQLLPVSKLICPPVFKSPVSTAVRLEKKMKGEGNLHIHDVISIFPDNIKINPSNFILMQTLRPRNEAIPYSAKISPRQFREFREFSTVRAKVKFLTREPQFLRALTARDSIIDNIPGLCCRIRKRRSPKRYYSGVEKRSGRAALAGTLFGRKVK